MPTYSFSQIKVFEQCPLKYRYQYIDKIKPEKEPQNPHFLLGSAVHWALERLYKQLNQMTTPSQEEVVGYVRMYREKEIDRTQIVFPEESPEDLFLRRGEMYVRQYYEHHAPFGDVKVVMTEGNIVFSLDDANQIKFRGVIDRLDKEGNAFIINDYKTNKHLPEEDKSVYKEQLTLYALGVKEKYGKYFDILQAKLHYLHFDLLDEREVTQDLMDNIKQKYITTVREIEDRRFHANMGATDRFPAVENPSCRFCSYQSICPIWAHESMDDEVVVGDKTAKGLIDEYVELSQQARDLKKKKDQLKDILQTYALKKNVQKLFGNEHVLSAKPSTYYSITDKMGLAHYLDQKGLLAEYQDIDRYAIQRALKDEELDVEDVQGMIEVKESVTLRVGKK